MKLIGRSYGEIVAALCGVKRSRLIGMLAQLATLEPFFSPDQVAEFRGVTKAAVMKRIRNGTIRAHMPVANRWRIPLSAVLAWDEQTRVTG